MALLGHGPARLALLATRLPRKARAGTVAGAVNTDEHELKEKSYIAFGEEKHIKNRHHRI